MTGRDRFLCLVAALILVEGCSFEKKGSSVPVSPPPAVQPSVPPQPTAPTPPEVPAPMAAPVETAPTTQPSTVPSEAESGY